MNILYFLLVALILISFSLSLINATDSDHLSVYAADSLNTSMFKFISIYENIIGKPGFVKLTCAGSNTLVNNILNGGTADVFLSADYKLIDNPLIIKNYTKWNGEFARNSVVILYNKSRPGADKINGDNWFNIFNQQDVNFGLGDPNQDPCGYRSVMDFAVANNYKPYSNSTIFEDLISKNSEITAKANERGYDIYSPTNAQVNRSKLLVFDHTADATNNLINGSVGYAFVYKNQAEEAKNGNPNLDYVTLPSELSLNDTQYEDEYSNYKLHAYTDDSTKNKTFTLSPIVYGLTQLSASENPEYATKFLDLFMKMAVGDNDTSRNNSILRYMDPIFPLRASAMTNWHDIPASLLGYFDISTNFTNLSNTIKKSSYVTLDSDVVLGDDEKDAFKDGIVIDHNLVLNGQGHKIDARKLARIFQITKGRVTTPTVTITNVTLVNGKASKGGAIYNQGGTVNGGTEKNTIITGNTASRGGAIYTESCITGSSSTISGFTIKNNTASYGGGVYNTLKSIVKDCNITDNTASFSGGAIYNNALLNPINGDVNGCNITNNNAIRGGGIYNSGGTIKYCSIKNNTASFNGGGIYFSDIGFVFNSIFKDNKPNDKYWEKFH
jgi:molybdate/tungstate transport system substrate-binding protein